MLKLTITNSVVERHSALVNIANVGHHAVEVNALHEHPGKGTHEEVLQDDGDHFAQQL